MTDQDRAVTAIALTASHETIGEGLMMAASLEARYSVGELWDDTEYRLWQTHYILGRYGQHIAHERIMQLATAAYNAGCKAATAAGPDAPVATVSEEIIVPGREVRDL